VALDDTLILALVPYCYAKMGVEEVLGFDFNVKFKWKST
jgi:hypothetical protein